MRLLFCALVLMLAACNAPGPLMRGMPAQQVTVNGDTYDVRRNGPYMQAIRRNLRGLPRISEIAAGAEAAMEQVSGCDVAWLTGDVAVMVGGLSCDGEKPPKRPAQRGPDIYDCAVSTVPGPVTLDCTRL
ncbi:hypothetical protein [Pseudaestuariivita atlantica]|uniref:hypothetical protein n=1 Tax=Pseudaestuariivita atlantica TaxID=1317121 RepID=UPI00067DC171|nr:hypothetical protein [Pseudaestuariivita atlantica]